ncbi:nicotinate-nucleotide--dimethylbenzimidazole phosphoribosyltransferase [Streptomyces sp. SLBN-134]|uniref:nicotinate-nucleotide--dimethylbenzimidazole phosphoribosyltransferase n=1 Tax=Streptomyces sp. SLBN-134 TaxID=2768456 RepID=UPI001151A136|nr:nicotinate-nucleotide--dimethylbenzimidazole phosphoribosyltransferase [Streptomyces sp. SLBN-134]TQL23599.1 nicotinate-nucleotide-dimethylbenzimidazole phosphoribosyltransferase /cob(II)yrinic acid a,c-diamide reductase [Streptomyces sp. SLBN-134]
MTDTGQVPGEGLPENAGMVEQPGVIAPEAYTYLSDSPAEDEDLLLPGAQSAWGNEIAPPAPEPVVETVHEPGPHETAGRDSGSVDLSGVRLPEAPQPAQAAPRRPLHLGPPIPNVSAGPVRSLADRGPADLPARHAGPPTLGPEYLDIPRAREATAPQGAAPWVAQAQVGAGAPTAETVVPVPASVPAPQPVDVAQAVVARVATEAGAVQGSEAVAVAEAPRPEAAEAPAPGAVPPAEVPAPQLAQEPGAVGEAPPQAVAVAPEPDVVPEPAPAAGAVPVTPAEAAAPEDVPVAGEPQAVPAPAAAPGAPEAPDAETAVVGQDQEGAEAAQTVEPPIAEATVPPVTEAVDAVEAPAAEVAEAPVAPVAEAAPAVEPPAAEAVAPEHVPAPEAAAPEDIAPVAVPEAAPSPEAAAPEADTAPVPAAEPMPSPEAAALPEPSAAVVTDAVPSEPSAAVVGDAVLPEPSAAVVGDGVLPEPSGAVPDDAAPVAVAPEPEQAVEPEAAPPVPEPAEAVAAASATAADEAPADAPPAVVTDESADPAAAPAPADGAPVQGVPQPPAPLPATVGPDSEPGLPLGEFVPVDGTVPTAPHLAPTPPQGVTVPAEEPREADAEPAQNPDDLDTQGAGVDEEAAAPPAGPAAPGYDDAEREAVLKVMRERRDIRKGFRGDPIPHEVLLRVLEAAHTAPSVGHSQPWDFVVIRSADTRRAMHELAMRQREAYAKSLPKGRAKQFKELKIEAILDTPVNIVVTADPTRGGRHTLGRHTQPQMAPYSSALAVENLWLAARAEGLGVGWVSFFDEREMVRALGLPEHLEVVAYLCVGYVDEFPDEPELMQAGWSKRRPLSWVVHEETYGRRALPGEDPHDLLAETVAQIRPLDAKALGEAWERQKRMTKPAGALGMLEIISAQLSGLSRQCPPPIPEPAAVAIFAGDHGVHAQGVTPWPQEVTAQMVANFLGGGAVCNAFAAQVGAEVCVVDVGVSSDLPATPGLLPRKVRAGTSDMTTGPAMTREEAKQAIEVGIETARDLVAAGNKALLTGEMGIANTTASAALISVFTGADPAEVTGRGTGINDETLARKTEVVRRALEFHQPDPADPIGVLAAVGGFEHAAMVGLLLGGASLRTPVILDGVSAGAAALVARAIAPEVLAACIAGHRSAEPGHVAALNKLGLRPLVDLDLRLGEGTGALLALPLVQSTARAMHEVATFDSAGVTEK